MPKLQPKASRPRLLQLAGATGRSLTCGASAKGRIRADIRPSCASAVHRRVDKYTNQCMHMLSPQLPWLLCSYPPPDRPAANSPVRARSRSGRRKPPDGLPASPCPGRFRPSPARPIFLRGDPSVKHRVCSPRTVISDLASRNILDHFRW